MSSDRATSVISDLARDVFVDGNILKYGEEVVTDVDTRAIPEVPPGDLLSSKRVHQPCRILDC